MSKFASTAWSFFKSEDGPTAVEYAVMMALIIMVCFAAIASLGSTTGSALQNAANSIH
jgi:pilus assembly protein Flp/PilA